MPNYISEDDIEKAAISLFKTRLRYDHIDCFQTDHLNRTSETEVVFFPRLQNALKRLNPSLPDTAIDDALARLCKSRQSMSPLSANRDVYNLIRDGVTVTIRDKDGKLVPETVRVIDFGDPAQNDFLVVSQLWIQGRIRKQRPDLLIFINGLPLVFIELKNSDIALKTAYDHNLTNYRREIPRLFHYNAIAILSNGMETRVGSFSAEWEHFGQWLRVEDEKETMDRTRIKAEKISLEYALNGLCEKKRLLDYIENFIFFFDDASKKIIARNHQFLGVNNAITSFEKREGKKGKLGVFFHTQGSGKSFSMIFFTRKIFRKYPGNYTFAIITDRDDLDGQIYRNFLRAGAIRKSDKTRPETGEELREMLGKNNRYVFTLIQKFHWPKGKAYPLLSDRDDIIVIVDEAHRTQYKDLAENMRSGLPNAQYIAFTATPLLGSQRKTNKWFGNYVSEYNFKQSWDDGATVPIFYSKRVPEVQLINDELDNELIEIFENENLTDKQRARVEKKYATELEVIKRPERLETIAKDIVKHFPRRGYPGKGIVVSVDKFTAVRMYDLVKEYRDAEIRELQKQIYNTKDELEAEELKHVRQYLENMDMAVVVSPEDGEKEKFAGADLDIEPHRKRMNDVDENGHDLEYKFKNPDDPLQLVFVCAMWLTGFDAPTASVLYLDKPMKNHTLMQAIARVNRVAPGKTDGLIVDYYGVFRNLKRALSDYAAESEAGEAEGGTGDDPKPEKEEETGGKPKTEEEDSTEMPVQDMQKLYDLLNNAILEGVEFCRALDIDLHKIRNAGEIFRSLSYFKEFADILLAKDDVGKQFGVYENTVTALYEACKPDILYNRDMQDARLMVQIFQYLRKIINRNTQEGDMAAAEKRLTRLLDKSVALADGQPMYKTEKFSIRATPGTTDLSQLDFGNIRKRFEQTTCKHIEIADLRLFIEKRIEQMLNRNVSRNRFADRFQKIIDDYNSGSLNVEAYFEELMKFSEDLREEEKRHIKENLTEEELEIFDLLSKDGLTQKEKKEVRLAARTLLAKLREEKQKLFTLDWHKFIQSREIVKDFFMDILDDTLPESYDRKIYNQTCDRVYNHFFTIAETGGEFRALMN